MPGGVNSPVRAMGQIGRNPVFIESARGCHLTARDGSEYIDWVCSWGPMILGHADPQVLDAVNRAASRGLGFGAATASEVELAEEVVDRMPSVEMIRMTSSGTEAAMGAVRLARAITGRETLVKFSGAYHGHSDSLLVEAGSGVATLGIPGSPGVPEQVEPVPANMGVVLPREGFLAFLRELCDRHGTLLLFDEVITGFRVARGGAQDLYGVNPDLTVMGKILGGGLPAAAIGGPRRYLEHFAPSGDVYQAGTLSGNPVAVAAGLATLRQLDDDAYLRLGDLTDRLVNGLRTIASEHQLQVASVPGLATLFFRRDRVRDFADSLDTDAEAHARFCRGMLDRGVYLPPSRFEAWFVSLAHDERSIDLTLEAVAGTLAAITGVDQGHSR